MQSQLKQQKTVKIFENLTMLPTSIRQARKRYSLFLQARQRWKAQLYQPGLFCIINCQQPIPQGRDRSYQCFFVNGMNSVHVCKTFYLAALAVRQKIIFNVNQKKDAISTTKKMVDEVNMENNVPSSLLIKQLPLATFNSFPVVDAH